MAAFFESARALVSAGVLSSPLPSTHVEGVKFTPTWDSSSNSSVTPSAMFYDSLKNANSDARSRRWQNFQFRMGRDPRRPLQERKKVVVLGTGWAAMNFIIDLDVAKYDVTIISPRNYFTFTPLLPSVCVGTLSPRACLEPVRDKLMRGGKLVMEFHEAWATEVNADKKSVTCQTAHGTIFDMPYDYLVMAVGAETNTFGIPGVKENAYFLKEVENARNIHKAIIDNFEQASLPDVTQEEKERLMHFVVVGGGPTGVETAAEISDFVKEDASRHFPELAPLVRVSLVEMLPKVLPMFDQKVSDFTLENMKKLKIDALLRCRVTKIGEKTVSIANAANETQEIPYGFVLWASGVGQVPFIKKLMASVEAQKANRIMRVDENLKVIGLSSVYAMGDCTYFTPRNLAEDAEQLFNDAKRSSSGASSAWLEKQKSKLEEKYPQIATAELKSTSQSLSFDDFKAMLESVDKAFKAPPPTAQNAKQEGNYLATVFNRYVDDEEKSKAPAFVYRWKGSMAYVGDGQSVIETSSRTMLGGASSILLWKMFYWSQQMSFTNKLICLFDWSRTKLRGRDVGRDHTSDAIPPPPQN